MAGLLLVEDQHRLAQLGIARAQLFQQDAGLCVLAAQAEHGCAGDVGMMDVAGEQAAECVRILARAAAAELMGEKADAVEVGKDALRFELRDGLSGAVAVRLRLNEAAHVLAITRVGAAVAELFFERLAHLLHIAVLAEDQRQHDPVVARAHLAIGAMKAHEGALGPRRCVGQRSGRGVTDGGVVAGAMADVARGEQSAARNGFNGFAHDHAVHEDEVAGLEIGEGHLLLGGDGLGLRRIRRVLLRRAEARPGLRPRCRVGPT